MIVWLTKFKISAEFDRRQFDARSVGAKTTEQFALNLHALNEELSVDHPQEVAVPAGLHQAIMRAVHSAERERLAESTIQTWRWGLAVTAALVLLTGTWWELSQREYQLTAPPGAATFSEVTLAFEHGRNLPQAAPDLALAPLAGEMKLVDRDIKNALSFLVASLP